MPKRTRKYCEPKGRSNKKQKVDIEDSLNIVYENRTPTKTQINNNESQFDRAKRVLQIGFIPKKIVCRTKEVRKIKQFLKNAFHLVTHANKAKSKSEQMSGTGGRCLYISGVPGTGKTSTLLQVLQQMKNGEDDDEGDEKSDFDWVHINARKLTKPGRVMSTLWKLLSQKKVSPSKATSLLEEFFSSTGDPIVVVIDELDYLISRKQKELYTIVDWPSRPRSRLIVIGIANTLDLPERVLLPRIASRFGTEGLSFAPYSREQLTQLIQSRLEKTEVFDADAIAFCSMKISSTLGDARRALNLCRQAIEVAENKKCSIVTTQEVKEAFLHITSTNIKDPILHCSDHEKLFLCSLVCELKRKNLENEFMDFKSICDTHFGYCKEYTKLKKPSLSELSSICQKLTQYRLIISSHSKEGVFQKLQINGSIEDFMDALSQVEPTKPIIMRHNAVL